MHVQSHSELFGKLNNKTGNIHNALNAQWGSWTKQKTGKTWILPILSSVSCLYFSRGPIYFRSLTVQAWQWRMHGANLDNLGHKGPALPAKTPVHVSLAIGLRLPGPSLLQLSHHSTPLPRSPSLVNQQAIKQENVLLDLKKVLFFAKKMYFFFCQKMYFFAKKCTFFL